MPGWSRSMSASIIPHRSLLIPDARSRKRSWTCHRSTDCRGPLSVTPHQLPNQIDGALRGHHKGVYRPSTSEAGEDWSAVRTADLSHYPNWCGHRHGPAAGQALIDRVLATPDRRRYPPKAIRLDMILSGSPPFMAWTGQGAAMGARHAHVALGVPTRRGGRTRHPAHRRV